MWRLYQFPLCPFSRKVRLLLAEKQIAHELHEVLPWERDPTYRELNHIGQTPAMHDPDIGIVLADSRAICEFFEETAPQNSLMLGSAEQRAEIRRLVAWFDEQFYAQVTAPLLCGRLIARHRDGTDCTKAFLADAQRNADTYLDEVSFLVGKRSWLAGPTLSLADLAAAAQISIADYLSGINWSGHDQALTWYSVFRSRRSSQPLLAERMTGIDPPPHYANLDA